MICVLILEDDPIISMDIKSLVDEMDGFHGFIASDMQNALKIASKHHIQIMISDIQIKGFTDGIETTQIIQNMYNCQVIFLTSKNCTSTLTRASKLNFSGYILKPFREEELTTSLKLCAMKITVKTDTANIGCGYSYDEKRQQLFFEENPISLTPKEHQLFLMLLNSRGTIIPFSYIDEVIWSDTVVSDTARRQILHRLRAKLPKLSFSIVKYSGYMLEECVNASE